MKYSNHEKLHKLTVMVNSCDAYEDLWVPFFTLYKKYSGSLCAEIILNTESKEFSLVGLDIVCVHCPGEKGYGERILNALAHVKTEYVLMLLDDFFLRRPLNVELLGKILSWMDEDESIVCFNSENLNCYTSWETERYPGHTRIPPANSYGCNMQAAIWRTDALKRYWRPNVSPWEWEEYCSLLTARFKEDKLYCRTENGCNWIDYGHYTSGDLWAVVRGKWILDDVKPLFDREHISVDFSQRGPYLFDEMKPLESGKTRKGAYINCVARCLGICGVWEYIGYRIRRLIFSKRQEFQLEFFGYMQEREKCRFLKSKREFDG